MKDYTRKQVYKQQTSLPPAEFKPTISAGEWPQNYILDHMAIGTSNTLNKNPEIIVADNGKIYNFYSDNTFLECKNITSQTACKHFL
jgi:hypothetical protein